MEPDLTPEQIEKVRSIAQNYAPHHGELRAYDQAWFAMGAICDALGITTGEDRYEEEDG